MTAAMGAFAVEDMALKAAGQTLPAGQLMVLFGAGGAAVFAALALARGERLATADSLSRPILLRAVFELFGRLFYTLAIIFTPLSLATAILQATPIVVVAGAAAIFGEAVGWRRWTAILVGLAGVLVILRPGQGGFDASALLAVAGMLGFAGRDLATRSAPLSLGTFTLGVYGFVPIVVAGLIYMGFRGEAPVLPAVGEALAVAFAVLVGVAAYSALTLAMRTGAVAAVTPFRYTRLLFGVALGVLVFGERPDAATVAGSLIVVASGVFILLRSGRRPAGGAGGS